LVVTSLPQVVSPDSARVVPLLPTFVHARPGERAPAGEDAEYFVRQHTYELSFADEELNRRSTGLGAASRRWLTQRGLNDRSQNLIRSVSRRGVGRRA